MSINRVTIQQLIEFTPENDTERDIYNINQNILNNMIQQLEKDIYYLGGQIKMSLDDEINMELFCKVREINNIREKEYGNQINNIEKNSIQNHKKNMEETEKIVAKYFEIMNFRMMQNVK